MFDALFTFSHQLSRTILRPLEFRETREEDILQKNILVFRF